MTLFARGDSAGVETTGKTATVTMRGGAAAIGDVLKFDLGLSDAAVSGGAFGAANSGYSNVLAGADFKSGIFCVASEVIADDDAGEVVLSGRVQAFVIKASGSIAVGDFLVPATAMNLDGTPAAGERYIAIADEAATTPTTRVLKWVVFDGEAGYGNFVS